MKLKFIAAAALAALLGSSAASAGEDVGWYAIGSVGAANADSNMHDEFSKAAREGIDTYDDVMSNLSETDRDNLSSAFARASVKTDKTDFAFKLGLGYRFNDYFALEGAYYSGTQKVTLQRAPFLVKSATYRRGSLPLFMCRSNITISAKPSPLSRQKAPPPPLTQALPPPPPAVYTPR